MTPQEASLPLSRRRLVQAAAGMPWLLPGGLLAATPEVAETENNWEGPYYKAGAPMRSVLLEPGMAGTPLTVAGRVTDVRGQPLKGALLDFWHADHTGNYDNTGFRLRGKLLTDEQGRYTLRTIQPVAYGEPKDKRPAHIHVKASLGSGPVLTTQLYFQGDPWNRHDPGVRPSLVMAPRKGPDGLAAQFDFVIRVA